MSNLKDLLTASEQALALLEKQEIVNRRSELNKFKFQSICKLVNLINNTCIQIIIPNYHQLIDEGKINKNQIAGIYYIVDGFIRGYEINKQFKSSLNSDGDKFLIYYRCNKFCFNIIFQEDGDIQLSWVAKDKTQNFLCHYRETDLYGEQMIHRAFRTIYQYEKY